MCSGGIGKDSTSSYNKALSRLEGLRYSLTKPLIITKIGYKKWTLVPSCIVQIYAYTYIIPVPRV